jgi:putative acetyltransferase
VKRGDAVTIRPEAPQDAAEIAAVHARAFPTREEALLVDRLREAGALDVSRVAERGGRVVGHVAISPVRIVGASGAWPAHGLGPVSVLPDAQGEGIGGALVRAALEACRAARHDVVFVLGHAAYYPRFGFAPAAARGLVYSDRTRDYTGVFFVAELVSGALAGRAGVVYYRPEFQGL